MIQDLIDLNKTRYSPALVKKFGDKMSDIKKLILKEITDDFIGKMLERHEFYDGVKMDKSLAKLFLHLNDESNLHEVKIKVAALNKLYSTAIQNINPVAEKIQEQWKENNVFNNEQSYVDFIDKISNVIYGNKPRNNLSFASKYVHFLSNFQTPIYDSYIWIVMIGYLKQSGSVQEYSFITPNNYADFYKVFNDFKTIYNLQGRENYEIDKFLWQYGKLLIDEIQAQNNNLSLEQAKSVLKKQL